VPELPMFPLGTVLLPHMVLPLHVFEPRYRALVTDVLAGDGEFGVVLITRGHEVGGGDQRGGLGTVARVVQAEELEDGRWVLLSVGVRRIEVERWLPDDPYPRAVVRERGEEHEQGTVTSWHDRLVPRVRRVLDLQQRVGEPGVAPDVELTPTDDAACWQTPIVSPLTPHDRQRLLATDDCGQRLRLLDELLVELEDVLTFRIGEG
jgi:uncharacterized protein